MPENVIILGAGASFAAGIPLLRGFMDRIWQLAHLGVVGSRRLTTQESHILCRAVEIRDSLRDYHAQVSFDQFNIEDILSILSFEALAGTANGQSKLDEFTKAISLTIELSCEVTHDGRLTSGNGSGPEQYRLFWRGIFEGLYRDLLEAPAILSFNYDLVLERALLQTLIGQGVEGYRGFISGKQVRICYGYTHCQHDYFNIRFGDFGRPGNNGVPGLYLSKDQKGGKEPEIIDLPLIKLHGSLNFPKNEKPADWNIVNAVEDPVVLPPVFNKATTQLGASIWKAGMEALRKCKNLIICGYSLPTTDIYMQYFLKSALGPNADLNRIYVFDPALNGGSQDGEALMQRYSQCFSPQFQKRIQFGPEYNNFGSTLPGTFEHLAKLLSSKPEALLFGVRSRDEDTSQPRRQRRPRG